MIYTFYLNLLKIYSEKYLVMLFDTYNYNIIKISLQKLKGTFTFHMHFVCESKAITSIVWMYYFVNYFWGLMVTQMGRRILYVDEFYRTLTKNNKDCAQLLKWNETKNNPCLIEKHVMGVPKKAFISNRVQSWYLKIWSNFLCYK